MTAAAGAIVEAVQLRPGTRVADFGAMTGRWRTAEGYAFGDSGLNRLNGLNTDEGPDGMNVLKVNPTVSEV